MSVTTPVSGAIKSNLNGNNLQDFIYYYMDL